MATYIVTYDLHQRGQNYDCINAKLKGYGTYWHIQGSVWIIKTAQTAVQVRDSLRNCLDGNDKLVVARLSSEAAWYGYNQDIDNWLKGQLAA